MKYVLACIAILLFWGCAGKTEYVDRPVEVKIPIMCEIPMPAQPDVTIDLNGLRNVLMYTETLECALHKCRGEVCK